MKKYIKGFLMALTISAGVPAVAQIPHVSITPLPATPKTALDQVIQPANADFEVTKDAKNNDVVYKGIFSYTNMESETSFSWLPNGIDAYQPEITAIVYLRKNLKKYKLLVFLGTWCGDSKEHIPALFRTLSESNIAYNDLMMVGMDRDKTTTGKAARKLVRKYKIKYLPTIVVTDARGHEVGRITESVEKSIEQDLAAIIKEQE
jgi:thiol-disulfide isomerase/thioredoxin